jgi:hypothetical protein
MGDLRGPDAPTHPDPDEMQRPILQQSDTVMHPYHKLQVSLDGIGVHFCYGLPGFLSTIAAQV